MSKLHFPAFFILLLVWVSASAMDFTIEALFTDKAMIKMNGKRILLKAGEEKQGLTLIKSDAYKQTAVIEINGHQETYELGRHIGGGYEKPENKEVMVNMDQQGRFVANGRINGRSVKFVLDTGAAMVAINENQARSFNIAYKDESNKIQVSTAGGNQTAYRVIYKQVSVGGISFNNVSGVVVTGSSPKLPLLGMTFLSQIEMEQKQNLMVLRKKY